MYTKEMFKFGSAGQQQTTFCKTNGNAWNASNTKAKISPNGLQISANNGSHHVFALQGFEISERITKNGNYPGKIMYYFEVTQISESNGLWPFYVSLSNGNTLDGLSMRDSPNCYTFWNSNYCLLEGKCHEFEWPNGAIKPKWNNFGDTIGCGLLRNSHYELSIFFTGNGIFLGKQIPITPSVDFLFPTVRILPTHPKGPDTNLKGNFGDDPGNPFKFDIQNCP